MLFRCTTLSALLGNFRYSRKHVNTLYYNNIIIHCFALNTFNYIPFHVSINPYPDSTRLLIFGRLDSRRDPRYKRTNLVTLQSRYDDDVVFVLEVQYETEYTSLLHIRTLFSKIFAFESIRKTSFAR